MARILTVLLASGVAVIVMGKWNQLTLISGWGLPSRIDPPMMIVAHRGNMDDWPEDSAEAIWDAARLGADGIEFDVHRSSDGTWWVMHDPVVDRTTNGSGWIHEMTDGQIAGLVIDGGPGFDPRDGTVLSPPRLRTVLDGLLGYSGHLYLDVQHAVDGDVSDLVQELSGFGASVICRNEADVRLVHKKGTVGAIIRPAKTDTSSDADGWLLESVEEATVERVRLADRPVSTFTDEAFAYLGEDAPLKRAWAAGVDAFLTKHLKEALLLRESLLRQHSAEASRN